jgi:hypothetical protein
MRLTLRTLLAYLDDILEPSQAREIGEKLNESSFASSLVSRIREVMRRRRLTAPTLSGPGVGIDPNMVAEYLDNTLPPDGVADVEKICLESDVHLAEAAACHQILTLALGEPVDVSSRTRERMYALGPSATKVAVPVRAPGGNGMSRQAVDDVLGQAQAAPTRAAVAEPHKVEIPDYLRPKSSFKKILAYLAVAAVGVFWGVLMVKNSPFKNNSEKPDADKGRGGVAVAAADGPKRNAADAAVPDQSEGVKEAVDDSEKVAPAATSLDERENPLTADTGARKVTSAESPDSGDLNDERPAATKKAASPAAPRPGVDIDVPAEKPAPAFAPAVPSKYTSSEGVTLHYVRRDERWFVLPRRAQVHVGDDLAVPDPFQCVLDIEGGKGLVTITGRSAVHVIEPTEAGPFGLELVRGQFVVKATGSGDEEGESLRMGVGIAGELWRLEIRAGGACGVQVNLLEPTKFEEALDRNAYLGAFYASAGASVVVTDPAGRTHELNGPDWLELPLLGPGDGDGKQVKKRRLEFLPKWMGPPALTSTEQNAGRLFERKFSLDEAVELSVPEVASDPNPRISQLATECLGLIGAYGPLVDVLHRSQHEEARKAAISGLRVWLPRHPENKELLKAELSKRLPPDDAEAVYKLLWGYGADDARNKVISTQLVEWMGDPELAIRELAFYHVNRLTGKDFDYRAGATLARLKTSLKRWQDHVKNHGGLIPVQKPSPNPQ